MLASSEGDDTNVAVTKEKKEPTNKKGKKATKEKATKEKGTKTKGTKGKKKASKKKEGKGSSCGTTSG
jgi:hypothetical protein